MIEHNNNNPAIGCRQARGRFSALVDNSRKDIDSPAGAEVSLAERHLRTCARCEREFRLYGLGRAALDLAAAPELVTPGDDFFVALRARIARGDQGLVARTATESWSAVLLLTARQLIPAMAMLLLIIIALTLASGGASSKRNDIAVGPGDGLKIHDIYADPEPTPDEVIEMLVAVEEKKNGR